MNGKPMTKVHVLAVGGFGEAVADRLGRERDDLEISTDRTGSLELSSVWPDADLRVLASWRETPRLAEIGVCFSSSRIAGSTASTTEPLGARRYCGGRSEASALNTVPLEIPSCRATARADNPSARCSRRISAQSSTWITLSSS